MNPARSVVHARTIRAHGFEDAGHSYRQRSGTAQMSSTHTSQSGAMRQVVKTVAASFMLLMSLLGLQDGVLAQQVREDPAALITHGATRTCLDGNGSAVYFGPCNTSNPWQLWHRMGLQLVHTNTGKCLTFPANGGSPYLIECNPDSLFQSWLNDGTLLLNVATMTCMDGNGRSLYQSACQEGNTYQGWTHSQRQLTVDIAGTWQNRVADETKVFFIYRRRDQQMLIRQFGSPCGRGGTIDQLADGNPRVICRNDGFVGNNPVVGEIYAITAMTDGAKVLSSAVPYRMTDGAKTVYASPANLIRECANDRAWCVRAITYKAAEGDAAVHTVEEKHGAKCDGVLPTPDLSSRHRRLQQFADLPAPARFLAVSTGIWLMSTLAYGTFIDDANIFASDLAVRNEGWRRAAMAGVGMTMGVVAAPVFAILAKDVAAEQRTRELNENGLVSSFIFLSNSATAVVGVGRHLAVSGASAICKPLYDAVFGRNDAGPGSPPQDMVGIDLGDGPRQP